MEINVNALQVANSGAIWFLAAIVVCMVVVQTVLFMRLAYNASKNKLVNVDRKQCNRALRAGVISAIGPAFGVAVVMIGLIAILGGPMTWLRLSVIGGASTELTAARVGVSTAGGDIANALSMVELSSAWWTMTINACGWLVITWLFASRMEKLRARIGGGDDRWMEIFSSAATLGIFGAFCSEYIVVGVMSIDYKTIVATIAGGAGMFLCLYLSRRWKWIKEYALGFAMIIGLAAAMLLPLPG